MLEAELRAVLPDLGLGFGEISNLRRLTGGASRETWSFDAGDRSLIYRRGDGVGREAVREFLESEVMPQTADAELCAAIRDGADVYDAVRANVVRKLRISNPRHLLPEDR